MANTSEKLTLFRMPFSLVEIPTMHTLASSAFTTYPTHWRTMVLPTTYLASTIGMDHEKDMGDRFMNRL